MCLENLALMKYLLSISGRCIICAHMHNKINVMTFDLKVKSILCNGVEGVLAACMLCKEDNTR